LDFIGAHDDFSRVWGARVSESNKIIGSCQEKDKKFYALRLGSKLLKRSLTPEKDVIWIGGQPQEWLQIPAVCNRHS